jgi:hypothetical protein
MLPPDSCSNWEDRKHGLPQQSILAPMRFFLIYINDLSKIINDNGVIIPFENDTSIIITNSNLKHYKNSVKGFSGYAGSPRRNVPDFGRVFLMVKYTDITQYTYVQS